MHIASKGKPVIVGGIAGRGVVCAASYEARPFGVHSAMPMATARRLCPQAIFLPVRMKHYAEISRQIREIFFSFTPLVEPLSLDEAFLTPLPVGRIWGVGKKAEERLHALGVLTIGQLAAFPEKALVDHFGESGRHVWRLAHGLGFAIKRLLAGNTRNPRQVGTVRTLAQIVGTPLARDAEKAGETV